MPSVDIINSFSAVCLIKGEGEMQKLAPYQLMVTIPIQTQLSILNTLKRLYKKSSTFLVIFVNYIHFEERRRLSCGKRPLERCNRESLW